MGAPNAVRNGFEARVLGMDVLLWRAQEETRTEILPEGMVAPTARTAADLNTIVDSWLLFGELSVVAKRQTANYVGANGKRDRTDREHPWMVTMTLSDAEVKGKVSSFGKKVGQLVLGFEKRDAPLHLPRQMQKPPRPWSVTGENIVGRPSVADTARDLTSLVTARGLTKPPPARGQTTINPAMRTAGLTGVAPSMTTIAAPARVTAAATAEAEGRTQDTPGR
jgi:hypothetical protein